MLLGFVVDEWNLNTFHTLAALLGVALSLYVMQMWSQGQILADPPIIMVARRASLMLLSLSLLWLVFYANDKGWAPWPAQVLLVLAIDFSLVVTIVAAKLRQAVTAH